MDETNLSILAPPTDTFGTLEHRKKQVKTTGPGRPSTGQVQINVKCSKESKARYVHTCDRLIKAKAHRTRGDVFADMVESYLAQTPEPESKPAKTAAPKPSTDDLAGDRTEHKDIFFQPGLVEMLEDHCGEQTISEFLQNLVEAGFSARDLQAQNDELRAKITEGKAA
jgi:hypothetical protein